MKKYVRSLMLDVLLAVFLLWGWLRRKVQHLILLQRGRCLAVLSVLRRASPVWLFLTTGYEMRGKVFR